MKQIDKYLYFSAQDFANDESFWLWVIEEDPEQTKFWLNYIKENLDKKELIEEARLLIGGLEKAELNFSSEREKLLWERIENTRHNLMLEEAESKKNDFYPRRHFYKIAATISLLLISLTLLWFFFLRAPLVNLSTAYGEQKEFSLPDGSTILLNSNSKASFKDNWNLSRDREVWLTGEGFFHIEPKENKQKFIVHAGGLYIKVLGTSFNVRNRSQEVKVVLSTGKISLGLKNTDLSPLLLKPGDCITYQEQNRKFTRTTVDTKALLTWKKKQLHFKDETLGNIFQILQDDYNLQTSIPDLNLLAQKFTGTVPTDNLSVLFNGLRYGYNLDISQTGNKILLQKKQLE